MAPRRQPKRARSYYLPVLSLCFFAPLTTQPSAVVPMVRTRFLYDAPVFWRGGCRYRGRGADTERQRAGDEDRAHTEQLQGKELVLGIPCPNLTCYVKRGLFYSKVRKRVLGMPWPNVKRSTELFALP